MSLWIESFALVEAATGSTLFAPRDSNWSLDGAEWPGDAVVTMRLRKYPGDHVPSSFDVKLDCDARTAEVEGGEAVPLGKLEDALEAMYRRARRG